MTDWKREALRLYFDEHQTWGAIIAKLQHNFPGKHADQIRDTIRDPIRRDPRYKAQRKTDEPEYKTSNGWKNGQYESDRLIEICEEDAKSPRRILEAHGLDPDEWDVVTCRNNL